MSIFSASSTAHLHLVVTASEKPKVLRHCPRCKTMRPFASSGKFRVNAQKKLIDIWLIFRCAECDQTWNHPIHERKSVRAIPTPELDAFMCNDAALADRHAAALAGRSGVASSVQQVRVERRLQGQMPAPAMRLAIVIVAPPGNLQRLDRILASGLNLPRAELANLAALGVLDVPGAGDKALRRPALNGQLVVIDLGSCPPGLAELCRDCLT